VNSQWTTSTLMLLSQQILAVAKHVVDDNIVYLSVTQHMHAPAHGMCNTVQQLLHESFNFIFPELWLNSITRFRESTAA